MPNITKWKKFTKEELEQFVKESNSLKELAQKCGYSSDQGRIAIKEMLKYYGWEEPKQQIEDLTNKVFGKLTVLYRANDRYYNNNKKIYWHCKCECGNECDVYGEKLKIGETKSCGCLRSEKASELNLKVIPKGTKFGELTVIELLKERAKNGHTIYKCQCSCGNIINIKRDDLVKKNGTKSCGCINSKGEYKISQILRDNNISFEKQKTFENCRFIDTNALARFDFWINNQYLIEYDGIQHFLYSNYDSSWSTKEKLIKTQEHDAFKNKWCKDNNIPIIRIPYTQLENLSLNDLLLETSTFII